ncbi:hypothetical protein [Actinomadura geliboluensis]|uniref:hypothetical protein n=1 Tax=Actinomadura geliboluensis TaxID=882440 RepID=UPI00263A0798|nr:hypothetical protein [Actinomadura geliboluensis]
MEQTRQLHDSEQTVLDGSGNGSVRLGPTRHGVRQVIRRIAVQTSSDTRVPLAKIYRGGIGDAAFISGTFVGSFDADDGLAEELDHGEYLTVAWTGGDPGAVATATWSGDEITGSS